MNDQIDNQSLNDIVEKKISIIRTNPNGLIPVFVNDMSVTKTDDEFFLTFSLIEPPAFEKKEDIADTDHINAQAIVKLIFTPAFAKKVTKVLTSVIDKYERSNTKE